MRETPSPKILLVAAAVLVDSEKRFLIAQRPPSKSFAGMWEFPGGKIEPHETPEEGVVREVHEEIGISLALSDLKPLTFVSAKIEPQHLLMPVYLCRKWTGTPALLEHTALAWIWKDDAKNYDLLDSNTQLMDMIYAAL